LKGSWLSLHRHRTDPTATEKDLAERKRQKNGFAAVATLQKLLVITKASSLHPL
jgi:hypothetical protein